MPYNTRRKSLSLPALGIDLPKSARSPPVSTTDQPPAKKVKRSHTLSSTASSVATDVPHTRNARSPRSPHARNPLPRSRGGHVAEQTPPPSPVEPGSRKVDTQGIDDDIVVAVIEQLERTGNRPHHVKDLAAILSTFLTVVEG